MIVLAILCFVSMCGIVFWIFRYHWRRRHLYNFAKKLSGPIAFPVIGNSLLFACQPEDIFDRIMSLMKSYHHPLRFWLGPKLIVCISDAQHVEKILNSPKVIHKSYIYKFLNDFVKYGLVSHSGPRWKRDRKIIQPLINLQFIQTKFDNMQLHIDRLLTKIEQRVDGGIFNIESLLRFCNFDIMADILLDFSVDSQNGQNHNVVHAFGDVYMHVFNQMVKPWLHPKFIYNKTSQQRERQKLTNIARNFAIKAIEAACARKKQETPDQNCSSILDQILDSFLNNGEEDNVDVLIDHILTLLAASEDTATIVSSAAFVVFGLYPEYQKQAFEEIKAVLGENPRHIRIEELSKLPFIDMCLKDVLRLFPIAPFIVRMCTSDLNLGDFTIPEGCEVMIPILSIHKNQKYYQYPNDFYPYHFQQGYQETRPKAAFIPFSMGFRNCIGKHLGISILKLLMIQLLWRYEFISEGMLDDIKYTTDISLRFRNGYMVYVKRRDIC